MSIIQPTIELIQTPENLSRALKSLESQAVLYFDLEADNINHYYSTVSLIQIYIPNHCFCFDMYAEAPWENLLKVLKDKLIIVHGADFDLRCLYDQYHFKPKQIFDTMLGARLIGEKEFGLSALVHKYVGLELEKQFQKADWSKRPLPLEMIRYAATDTFYLPQIQKILSEQLEKLGRTSWHEEWCEHEIAAACQERRAVSEDVWRVKGSHNLKSRQLAFLKSIWGWREKTAQENNRATFRVIQNSDLVQLAQHASHSSPDQLEDPEHIPLKLPRKWKKEISTILTDTYSLPKSEWPSKRKIRHRPDYFIKPHLMELLKDRRNELAQNLGLPSSLLASKDALQQVARLDNFSLKSIKSNTTLMNWQADTLWSVWENIIAP